MPLLESVLGGTRASLEACADKLRYKLERQISSLTSRSKEATALKKLCDALNIERDDSLPQLLARLRAIDIMKKPL